MSSEEAQRIAGERELDLVEVAPNSSPPVCRLMNYGKFKYEQQKKEQQQRRRSHGVEMKELRLGRSIRIERHDMEIKLRKARDFLDKGHRLQVFLQLRGREMAHADIGVQRLKEFAELVSDIARVEQSPRIDRRRVSMLLVPEAVAHKKKSKEGQQAEQNAQEQDS